MKGIAGITGNLSPLIGQDAYYEVNKLYPGTVISDYSSVKWKVYRESNGQWVELKGTLKTGKRVSFNFPQKWYGKQLLIEAYINNPEKKSPPGIIVKPIQGPKNIRKIELRDANGNPLAQKPKYGQNITAQISTENMLGDTLKLSLWERDTLTSEGHDPKGNTRLWEGTVKVTETNGVAKKSIMLSPAMMTEANKSLFEGGEHEYYMLVQASNVRPKYSSQTMLVQNEIVLSKTARRVPAQPAAKPKTMGDYWEQIKVTVLNGLGINEMPATGQTATTVNQNGTVQNCGERYCVKKGDKSELIREMNIRLNGFGGNVPTDEFTDKTEAMIKKFQKDYMKIAPTGKVCGNTLKAIDEFGGKFTMNFNQIKCPCGICSGYGQGKFLEEYNDADINEMYRKYEYPGIHRSLIWALKAIMFYLSDQEKGLGLQMGKIESGYRCHERNKQKKRTSTNHMGKALDVHFYPLKGDQVSTEANCDKVRDLMKSYMSAQDRWAEDNKIALEPSTRIRKGKEFIATTWVHYDVRKFDLAYKENRYFVTTEAAANGQPMTALAVEAKLVQMCSCVGTGNKSTAQNTTQAEGERVDPKTLSLSQDGIDFIKDWEKFEQYAYDDSEHYCTIGYGHLIAKKSCSTITLPDEFKNGITKERATELFNGRLAEFENSVKRDITVKLYQHEYDALVSLVFNTGSNFLNIGGANDGETQIKKKINKGEYAAGADEMSDVTNGGTSGLVKRRKAEINMFKNNVYDSTH